MITRRQLMAGIGASAALLPLANRVHAQSPFVPEFTAATGIKSQIDVGLGKDFVSKIRAGGTASPYSVFMGNENIAATLRAEGFFEPLDLSKIPNAANLHEGLLNAGNNGLRGIVSPIGLAWRTDMVETPPKSWTDLWENSEFAGRIGLYQIGNTGAQLFLRLAGKLFGKGDTDIDTAFAKIKELQPFTQASWSGEVATALMRGDIAIAPVDWTEILTLQDKGAPVQIRAELQHREDRRQQGCGPRLYQLPDRSQGAVEAGRRLLCRARQPQVGGQREGFAAPANPGRSDVEDHSLRMG